MNVNAMRVSSLSFGEATLSRTAWLARASVLLYAFALPLTHNAALKNFALLGMLIAIALTLRDGRLKLDLRSPVLLSVVAVMAVALLSSLLGNDVGENLSDMRQHFLPLLLAYPLLVLHFRRREALLALLVVLTAAFSIRAALALREMLTIGREAGWFFKGYGMDAALYIPIVMGVFMLLAGWRRYLVGAALLLAIGALVTGGTRTGVAAILLGCLVIPVALGYWRHAALFALSVGLVAGAIFVAKPELVGHYGHVLRSSAYAGPSGMSSRYPIWAGVWQVAQERPVLGHGFGWKKLGRTAVERGLVTRWQASGDPFQQKTAWWFSLPTDKVNPHSLVMQLLFEMGFVGLAAYAAMLAVLIWQALTLARHGPPEWRVFGAMILGFFASYLVINVANGLWLGTGPSTLLVAMLEICRQMKAGAAQTPGH